MKIHIAIADTNPAYSHRLGLALQDLSGGTYEITEWTKEKVCKMVEKAKGNEIEGFTDLIGSACLDALILDVQCWKEDQALWKEILGALANFPPKKKVLLWKGAPDSLEAIARHGDVAEDEAVPVDGTGSGGTNMRRNGTGIGDEKILVDGQIVWDGPMEELDPFAPVSQIFQILEEGLRKVASLFPPDEEKEGSGFMVVSAFDPGLRRQFVRKKLREYAQKGESCLYLPFMPIFDLQLPLAVVGPDYEEPDAPDHMGLSTALLAWENGLEPDQQTLLHTIKPYALDIGSYYGPKLNGRAEDILQCKPETLVQCARAYAQMMTNLEEGSHCLIEVHLPLSHLIPLARSADRFYSDFPAGPGTAEFFARQELRLLLAGLPDNIKVIELKYIADRKTREEYYEEKKRRKTRKRRWFAR